MRLFVALELPAAHRDALAAVCERGRRGGVLWVPPENVHITLKFLGDVPDRLVPSLKDALARVASAAKPFKIAFRGCGTFPEGRPARVVWIGVAEGAGEAAALAAAVDDALAGFSIPRERRPFRCHATIGRVKDERAGAKTAAEKVRRLAGFQTGAAEVGALVLVSSTLTPEGSVYKEVASFQLGGDIPSLNGAEL